MKAKFIAALVVASSAALAAPAFASGYGPAPYYHPDTGAPASQRGLSAQTTAVEQGKGSMVEENHSGVGGDDPVRSESGTRAPADSIGPMYRGG